MDFKAIFKAADVPFVEVGDWRSRVRPGTFTPEGILIHHTASTGFDGTLKIVRDGRPDLNGPLCNIYVARGKCYLISAGRANHAGIGAKQALTSLRANRAPAGTAAKLGYQDDPDTVGNGILVGFEVLSPGNGTLLPAADHEVLCQASVAILRALGKKHSARVIGHAEWTRRKIDPKWSGSSNDAHHSMNKVRARIAAAGDID